MIIPIYTNIIKRGTTEEIIQIICTDNDNEFTKIGFRRDRNNDIEVITEGEGFTVVDPNSFPADIYDIQKYGIKARIVEYLINSAGNTIVMYSRYQETFDLDSSRIKQEIIANIISFLNTRS